MSETRRTPACCYCLGPKRESNEQRKMRERRKQCLSECGGIGRGLKNRDRMKCVKAGILLKANKDGREKNNG